LKAEAGLALLVSGGLVQAAPESWLVGPGLMRCLPAASQEEAWKKACWSLPAYQAYLTGLAAGEIARRGLEGARELVESWVARQLSGRAAEFNAFLDAIEDDLPTPLSESTPGTLVQAVQRRLQKLEEAAGLDFAAWNAALLGISAPAEAVFQAALARGALTALPTLTAEMELLPIIDLNHDLNASCNRRVWLPELAADPNFDPSTLATDPAWQTRRYVFSSLPVVGAEPHPPPYAQEEYWRACCQHPIPWIIIQLALYGHIQFGLGAPLQLFPVRDEHGVLVDLRAALPEHPEQHLSERLPRLIACLGLELILPFGNLPSASWERLLAVMLQLNLLETAQDQLILGREFASLAFTSKYIQDLVRTPKPWRARLVDTLQGE